MKQLTQELKSGKMDVLEVPFPALNKGCILVRNHYSVISAGTEGKTVTDARKGYIAKARSRQKEVRQVLDMVKLNGLLSTYKLVMNKLEMPASLGYSTAGEVIEIGEGVSQFKVGDKVACGGGTASHADVVSVPENLCAKVPENVDLRHAAFSTIAAIALQGIRQADLRTGENCVVIGLGLIGQITAQILDASGVCPIGIDISSKSVDLARTVGIKNVFHRNQPGLEDQLRHLTNGHGVDAVIITAGTSSIDPVEFAGTISRKKGRVIIVGAVPTGFSREHYYKKELDLRMSSSYGPGRYDTMYEEKGVDYPIGYVRFTEQRNMQAYLQLMAGQKLNMDGLITHEFNFDQAQDAYEMILSRSDQFAGILLKYDALVTPEKTVRLSSSRKALDKTCVGFIGAGSFAQNMLLPKMKNQCQMVGVATARGNNSRYVAQKYGFDYCTPNAADLIRDQNINTVFITTRHNLHAKYLADAISAGKNVFVEKPMAMAESELIDIKKRFLSQSGAQPLVMVGFNRRFSPAVKDIKKHLLNDQPKSIMIRVNAGVMPKEHWVNDPEIGGGRLIGEACHFIDLAMHLAGGKITSVFAQAMDDPDNLHHTAVINLVFENGSVASVNYFSNGNKVVSKEYIEVFCGETVYIIDDFKRLNVSGKVNVKKKYPGQDKGHQMEVRLFLDAVGKGEVCPIPFDESYLSSMAAIKSLESIKTGRVIDLTDI